MTTVFGLRLALSCWSLVADAWRPQAVTYAYATYPIPLDLALKWYFSGLVMSMILGVIASRVYKP